MTYFKAGLRDNSSMNSIWSACFEIGIGRLRARHNTGFHFYAGSYSLSKTIALEPNDHKVLQVVYCRSPIDAASRVAKKRGGQAAPF